MWTIKRSSALASAFVLSFSISFPQASHPPACHSNSRAIHLDVVVTNGKKVPVANLTQSYFTILDNGVPQKITSFQPMTGSACPLEVIIVVDNVNTSYTMLAYERQQMDKFFAANGGKLPYLTTLAIFSDKSTETMNGFTQNGALLHGVLRHEAIGPRAIGRAAGADGAVDRASKSLRLLSEITETEARLPGRKFVVWMSPGSPLLSAFDVEMSRREQQSIFTQLQNISNQLRKSRVTLYVIDPEGISDLRASAYEQFLKPVPSVRQMLHGDLSLQALAVHTGGLFLCYSNDIAGMMQEVMDDAKYFYELTYTAPSSEPDTYHTIRVKIAEHGLKARTTAGYYSGY